MQEAPPMAGLLVGVIVDRMECGRLNRVYSLRLPIALREPILPVSGLMEEVLI